MAGLYLHIPFCGGTRCIYCDFYSTTAKGKGPVYVAAMMQELKDRLWHEGWQHQPFRTLYLGGGTPSQLPGATIKQLLAEMGQYIDGSHLEEVTIEANPEDVTPHYLRGLFRTKRDLAPWRVNRVSLGVQSLVDSELTMLGRRHDSRQVAAAIACLREREVANISIDLMYGLPGQTMATWRETITRAIDLGVEHISAYCLSVEPGTPLARALDEGRLELPQEDLVLEMASHLRFRLERAGYLQYEISNYARPGYESKHNSAYWTGEPYLGIGPGAHTYDGGRIRSWNAPDLGAYLIGQCPRESETLSDRELYNERIMLGLRTRRGVDMDDLGRRFPTMVDTARIEQLCDRQLAVREGNFLHLTAKGLDLGDAVIRDLFVV